MPRAASSVIGDVKTETCSTNKLYGVLSMVLKKEAPCATLSVMLEKEPVSLEMTFPGYYDSDQCLFTV
jgi:hypothetical protein